MRTSSSRAWAGAISLAAAGLLSLCGCKGLGPRTVARDRSDYSASISESWKRQMLLNIVKLRYLDPPMFVDVGQIVAGYSLETGINVGGQISSASAVQGNSAVLGAQGKFTDRPTITYTPLTGSQFVKTLMTPLPPESVFFAIQSGWPADGVLMAAASSINGLKNQETSIAGARPPDAGFLRALELFRSIQRSGAVSLRVRQDAQKQQTSLLTFRSADVSEATLAEIVEFRRLLRLDPEATEFTLVFGAAANNSREVAVLTRSMLHIMSALAALVDVPAEHIAQGRATPGLLPETELAPDHHLMRIRSSTSEPTDAFVAVPYRGGWFWVDDRDLRSKRAFSFMLILFTLSDTSPRESLPLITIPAQ